MRDILVASSIGSLSELIVVKQLTRLEEDNNERGSAGMALSHTSNTWRFIVAMSQPKRIQNIIT
jgi:hypothetical protein